MEIAKKSGDMYNKFVGFMEDLEKVGKQLETTQNTYTDAMKKLGTGKGNLVNRAEAIRKLGAKASKSLSPAVLKWRASTKMPKKSGCVKVLRCQIKVLMI